VLVNLIAVNQVDPYDSDSQRRRGFRVPFAVHNPRTPPFNDPNYETYKRGQQFMIVDHTANQRNGSAVSKIWQHSRERRRVDDGIMGRWQCDHCSDKRILKCPETGRGATSYPIRHLKNRHFIDLNADHQALPCQLAFFFGTGAGAVAGAATSAATTALPS
jgi:hypothetical protein